MSETSDTVDVSVVIPTYNAAQTIGAQLDALARQDYDGTWEVIVALQACDDDTPHVLAARTDANVRIVDASARLGAGYARNVGVDAALAPVIAFCDSDDVVADDWLTQLMSRRSLAPVLAGGLLRFEGELTPEAIADAELQLPIVECEFLPTAYTSSMLVERAALLDIGGFDLHFHRRHDVELAWRLQVAGYRIEIVPEAVVYYRLRSTQRRTWLQFYRWARYDPALYRRYARHGMRRSETRPALESWWWVITRAPFRNRNAARRERWLEESAPRAGRLVGSLLERTIYL